jgi:hypothetical protein
MVYPGYMKTFDKSIQMSTTAREVSERRKDEKEKNSESRETIEQDDDLMTMSGQLDGNKSVLKRAKDWVDKNITGVENESNAITTGLSNEDKLKLGLAVTGAALAAGCTEHSENFLNRPPGDPGKMNWKTYDINEPELVGFHHRAHEDTRKEWQRNDINGDPVFKEEVVGYHHSFLPRIKNTKVGTYEKPKYTPPEKTFLGPKIPRDKEVTLTWEEPVTERKNLGKIPSDYYTHRYGPFTLKFKQDTNYYEYDNNGNLKSATHGVKPVHRNTPVYDSEGNVKMKEIEKTFMGDEGCIGLEKTTSLLTNVMKGACLGFMMGAIITTSNKLLIHGLVDDTEEQLKLLDKEYAQTKEAMNSKEELETDSDIEAVKEKVS